MTEVSEESLEYQLHASECGAYTILRPVGRYSNVLLEEVRERFLDRPRRLAVDLSELQSTRFPLMKELYQYSKQDGADVVLLRPPHALRTLLRLFGREETLPVLSDESLLEGDAAEFDSRLRYHRQRLAEIRRRLGTDALWQYTDNLGRWLCPLCATVRDNARLESVRDLPDRTVEAIADHLLRCSPRFTDHGGDPWPSEVLEQILTNVNQNQSEISPTTRIRQLEEKVRKAEDMERHMEIAVKRQQHLLPASPPAVPGGEIAIIYRPASHISGDFYDFIHLNDGRLGLVIGDVAGHGIEAGIVMGMAKKVLQLRLKETEDPAAALVRTNNDLFEDLDRRCFVSAFVAVLDPRERTLVCARAGHPPPILFNALKTPRLRMVDPDGPILGVSDEVSYGVELENKSYPLEDGDIFLCYTDGLDEAKNGAGEDFGIQRVLQILNENVGNAADVILASLVLGVQNFTGGGAQEDDMTVLCLKVNSP